MKTAPPTVKINGVTMAENSHVCGDRVWTVANLVERAKGLPPFDLPIAALFVGAKVWGAIESPYEFAQHMRRVLDVDTSHPVILDQEGFIMDGWHRVTRALVDGKATIKAVRFDETAPHDYIRPAAA
jgi:hypothetical protein